MGRAPYLEDEVADALTGRAKAQIGQALIGVPQRPVPVFRQALLQARGVHAQRMDDRQGNRANRRIGQGYNIGVTAAMGRPAPGRLNPEGNHDCVLRSRNQRSTRHPSSSSGVA